MVEPVDAIEVQTTNGHIELVSGHHTLRHRTHGAFCMLIEWNKKQVGTRVQFTTHKSSWDFTVNEDDGTICVAFIAKKRIAKGRELLYSYGQEYWECSRQREALGLHTDYAHKAIRFALHQYSDLDAASKAKLVALYDEAADKQGWEGYRERFDIVRQAQLQQTPVLGARM